MIEATMNQLANISNPHQGKAKKVLCVCSAGLLRSPTLANILHEKAGYNTRACGSAVSFALIPISEALIYWADEIVFVDSECKNYLDQETKDNIQNSGAEVITLSTPDNFSYDDPVLKENLMFQYFGEQ